MAERYANLGYMAMKPEATEGVAVTPTLYLPIYSSSMLTNMNRQGLEPVVGQKFLRYLAVQGQRSHTGEVTSVAEPNTAGHLFNMLLTKGAPSGSDPYTHPFTLSATKPATYTIDQSYGNMVFRFIGVQASKIAPGFEDNEMRLVTTMSALKSFTVRELSGTPTGTNPYTIVLKTDYDPSPTTGLVVGDTMQLYKADGTTINFAVASIVDGTSITTTTDVTGAASGDFIYIRPATPSYSLKTPFLWSRTEFRLGATASAALSATHTPMEPDSAWGLMHNFNEEEGEKRSGSYDPAALARKGGDYELKLKRFFDTPDQVNRWAAGTKRACVVRHFSETGYELRVTLNNFKLSDGGVPPLESDSIVYHEFEAMPEYDGSDGQGFDVKVLSGLSTIA